MNRKILVQDAHEERSFKSDEFPLVILAHGDPRIRPATQLGGTQDAFAFLGLSEDTPYVQPANGNNPVFLNEQVLERSNWLKDGDTIHGADIRIECDVDAKHVRFRAHATHSEHDTIPPGSAVTTETAGKIDPINFTAVKPSTTQTRTWFSPLKTSLLLIFLGLLFVAWFMFTAHPVLIEIDPQPDTVELKGGLTPKVGTRYLLRPGPYTLSADKAGYYPLEQAIEISARPGQEISLSMNKLPGKLFVSTDPVVGARVTVDGEDSGLTPIDALELSPGPHDILIQSERYLDYHTTLAIEGMAVRQELIATLTPRWAAVSVRSTPQGATLWIDGEEHGTTPATVDLLEGTHTLEIKLERHKTWHTVLMVEANQPQELAEITLEAADGLLRLSSKPAGALVTVGSDFIGKTPVDVLLSPGKSHEITVSKAGFKKTTRSVELQSGEEQDMLIRMAAKTGEIRVISQPSDAKLYIDGVARGAASQRVTLTAVPHRLEIKKPGYQTFRTTVTPRAGFAQEIRATLKTLAQAKRESRRQTLVTTEGQKLKLMPPGRFTMGASRREQGRRANETLRPVELKRLFYISEKEITNEEFKRFQPQHSSGSAGRYSLGNSDHPVVNVTWEQAAGYCNWLSAKESLPPAYIKRADTLVPAVPMTTGYRLPTEAEWAWIARFGERDKSLKFPWGRQFPPKERTGNYADTTADNVVANSLPTYNDGFPVSAPVGSFSPNALGLYDLGGNVAEWVHDYYAIYPSSKKASAPDPTGPARGRHRVIRGAGWKDSSITELRLTFRDYGDGKRPDVGFRIARYAD